MKAGFFSIALLIALPTLQLQSPCLSQGYYGDQRSDSYANQQQQYNRMQTGRQARNQFMLEQQKQAQEFQKQLLQQQQQEQQGQQQYENNQSQRQTETYRAPGDREVDPMIARRRQRNQQLMSEIPPPRPLPGNVQVRMSPGQEVATFAIPGVERKASGPLTLRR